MQITADTLPDDVDALKQIILRQQHRLTQLEEYFRLFKHRRFGASSEKLPGQQTLFNEAEQITDQAPEHDEETPDTGTSDTAASFKRRGHRCPLPKDLPRIDVVHDIPDEARHCACGCALRPMGEEISEQLDIIPAQVRVIRHIRKKYACSACDAGPQTARLPPQPIAKSNASPGLLAHVAVAKYQDALPLHRQEGILQRAGIEIPRQTLARWMMHCAELLQPLLNLYRDQLLQGPVIHCDETQVQVLKEPDKPPDSPSYMWVQAGGLPDQPVVLFDYHPSRAAQVPKDLLVGYRGWLMTDGYEAYNAVAAQEGIEHLCCWAHTRRKFVEAQRAQPKPKKGQPAKTSKADVALNYIGRLYGIERKAKALKVDERYRLRQQESTAALSELRAWLDKTLQHVLPSGKLGEALQYLNKYWPKLIRYCEDGRLPIDNNRAENAIRPFVIGRNNWMFSDTPRGAKASAMLYSVIETAKANGLEPYHYLRRVFTLLPTADSVSAIEALLPWRFTSVDLLDYQ